MPGDGTYFIRVDGQPQFDPTGHLDEYRLTAEHVVAYTRRVRDVGDRSWPRWPVYIARSSRPGVPDPRYFHDAYYPEAMKVLPSIMPWLNDPADRERIRGWIGEECDWFEAEHMQRFGVSTGDESMRDKNADRGSETCGVSELI